MPSIHPLQYLGNVHEKHLYAAIRHLEYPFLRMLAEAESDRWRAQILQMDALACEEFGGEEKEDAEGISSIVAPTQLMEWQKASPASWLVM